MSDFSKSVYEAMNNGRQRFDVHLIEESTTAGLSESVRLYSAKRCLSSSNFNQVPDAMVELANAQSMTNTKRDAAGAMSTAVKMFRTYGHLKESWQTMGKLIEVAHDRYSLDLTECLSSYKPEELALLEMNIDPNSFISNTTGYEFTSDGKGQVRRKINKDPMMGIADKVDYPVVQDQDIWKGETAPATQDGAVEVYDDDEDFGLAEEGFSTKQQNLIERLQKAKLLKEQLENSKTNNELLESFVQKRGSETAALVQLVTDLKPVQDYLRKQQ